MKLDTLRRRQNMLLLHWKTALATALCAAACSHLGLAQVPPASILRIDTANVVAYFEDTSDFSKFGTDPNITTAAPPKNFYRGLGISDIVAVNGQRVMGTHTRATVNIVLRTAPGPGQTIADTERGAVATLTWEILKSDGTPIGTIVANGLTTGAVPPGSPLAATGGGGNFVITGGTGAFLGARGQMVGPAQPPGVLLQRLASMTEDPANRRRNGGGTQSWIAYLIPMARPEIVMLPAGPAITHSNDFSLVTSSKPAAAGEVLSLFATGLGPTVPAVDPGQPFPSSPLATVNSPIEVKVNGTSAEVLGAVGYAGSLEGYQVNFRVPPDAAKGVATIQVTAAWIAGSVARISVQ
jgi:uncharacterized protein (TIGR03437 family)